MTTPDHFRYAVPFIILLLLSAGYGLLFRLVLFRKKLFPSENSPGRLPAAFFFTGGIIVAGIVIIGYVITGRLGAAEKQRMHTAATRSLATLRSVTEAEIAKTNDCTRLMATSANIIRFCSAPSPGTLADANVVLDRYNTMFNASAAYLLDTTGTVTASSNRALPESFVGKNYAFRPYFTNAMCDMPNGFFALGITSNRRGYYNGAPVKNSDGTITGIAVIKSGTELLDSLFGMIPGTFCSDSNETIFLAADSTDLYRMLLPHQNPSDSAESANKNGRPSLVTFVDRDRSLVTFRGTTSLMLRDELDLKGWHLTTFIPLTTMHQHLHLGFTITAGAVCATLALFTLISFSRFYRWVTMMYISEKRFQTLYESVPEAIIICNVQTGRILSSNDPARTLFGKAIPDTAVTDILIRELTGEPMSLPLSALNVNGIFKLAGATRKTISVSSSPIVYEGSDSLVIFMFDISFIYEAQNIIDASERKYRDLADFLPEGVFETDAEGYFTYVNRHAYELLGYAPEDLPIQYTPIDLLIPTDRSRAQANIEALLVNRHQSHHEYLALHKSGRQIPILVHSTVIIRDGAISGICGVIIDLTERRKIEAELQKKDKLEALGILAGGIAHDFNNLLTAIWSGFSMMRIRCEDDADLVKIAEETEIAILRGRDLTTQLLTYSKGGAPTKSAASLVELVNTTAPFVVRGTNVKCAISAESTIATVEIDTTQISQVLQNLLHNSREAMPSGGIITITLKNRPDYQCPGRSDIPRGNYVELVISDCGSGIPYELQNRILDPFFTTKPDGTGLGLATASSIIINHSGHLYFESEPGKGTTFHILLPASDKKVPPRKVQRSALPSGAGSILLMDDEATILMVTQKLLTMTGFSVTTATGSDEAVEKYRQAFKKGTPFDCAILDLIIPAGPGAKETIIRLREIDPSAKAIVSSGYSNDAVMSNFRAYGFCAMIKKPYDIHQLVSIVNSVIATGEEVT